MTYANKIEKLEAGLDWRLSARQLERQVRAYNPFPGAAFHFAGHPLKVWKAVAEAGDGVPGSVLASGKDGIVVACGEGALRLLELQKAGGKRLAVAQFLTGTSLVPGTALALPS